MKWLVASGALVTLLAVGAAIAFTSPPRLLSIIDRIAGGGADAERAGTAIAFGNHGQTLDVWVPEQPGDAARPVIVFFYGGGWVKGDRDAYAFAGRAFADRGFVVVIPDYRKVPDVRFPAFIEDGAAAVRWTRNNVARFGGDPERIALAGHSAGAHTAVTLALDPRWLEAAEVGPDTVKAVIGLSGPYDFYPFDKKRSIDAMSRWPEPRDTQPIEWARAAAPPMLLITSSEDTVVRPYNTENLAAKLRGLGAPVETENYEGLSHEDVVVALSKPFRGKAPVLDRSVTFLDRAM
ncbi:alpha/beta hydrolase [Alteriqipengyuania lutimaris]|uniref:Alpha/beta hydrolase n=1 Tax=Alteriqipengyuania lutimaris TaxID=1538146 RepID=A0A395LM26_9SPHN|nr:alpha/beta hydrolase [Alteriqipengyuania lutimaris]MBB3034612.1 acetyl esterase/lipase [Alteriqipengyuania lutimaris]RDS76514.1 alpha/beta hydrolase [Alteriqipengyuania lutimaris]